jgi:hypothetical protein
VLLLVALVNRQWRTVRWASIATIVAGTTGAVLAGPMSLVQWIEVGRNVTWFPHPLNASLAGLVSRAGWGWHLWLALTILVFAATVVAVWRSRHVDFGWAACALAALLISPLGWVYYLPLLAGPLTAVAMETSAPFWPAVGFMWPVPRLMALAPLTPWAAITVLSIPSWSLLAMSSIVIYKSTWADSRIIAMSVVFPHRPGPSPSAALNGTPHFFPCGSARCSRQRVEEALHFEPVHRVASGQWTKNLLVFAGLIFGMQLFVASAVMCTIAAFARPFLKSRLV